MDVVARRSIGSMLPMQRTPPPKKSFDPATGLLAK